MRGLHRLVISVAVGAAAAVVAVPAAQIADVVTSVDAPVADAASAQPSFTPILPVRLLDTRPDFDTIDGQQAAIGRRSGGEVFELQVAGRGGIPVEADAAMFNVIAEQPGAPGYLTVFPCGPTPNASHVNYLAGQVVSNAAVSGLSVTGSVCLFTLSATDLVVDVTGFSLNGGVTPFTPERVLETRDVPNFTTIDRDDEAVGRVDARATYRLQIAGRGSTPPEARSAFLNVTAIQPDAAGYITVFPCDEPLPETSHVNYLAGQIAPNAVMAKLDGEGAVCLFSLAGTDLIVDVGAFAIDSVEPLTPTRLLDTRIGAKTSDALHAGSGRVGAGQTYVLDVVGRGGINDMSASAIVNVTAVDASENGFLTVYPCDRGRPNSSNVNYFRGQTVPNAVLARIDTAGTICIYTLAATHLIVDVGGYSLLRAPEFRRNVLDGDGQLMCGIRTDGSVSCWGLLAPEAGLTGEYDAIAVRDNDQACGIEKISMRIRCSAGAPDPSIASLALTDVDLESDLSCVLTTDGEPVCWGPRIQAEPPADVAFTTIDIGGWTHFSCGVTTDRSIACWGRDVGPAPAGEFLDVTVALEYACGLRTSGQLACWRRDGAPFEAPHGSFSTVDARRWEACALRDDGTPHCWLFSDSERLSGFEPDIPLSHLASGEWYACGLGPDEEVHCWGRAFDDNRFPLPDGPW